MMEYKETFLNEMKLLIRYFVEFSKDRSMLPKVYLDDWAVGISDQKTYYYDYT